MRPWVMAKTLVCAMHVVCGRCATAYSTWTDPSDFTYGRFLGVSVHGEVVVLDAFEDSTFDEVSQLVRSNPAGDLDKRQQVELFQEVLPHVYDPDSTGSTFRFTGTPGCPACGSTTSATWVVDEGDGWMADSVASHRRWDLLSDQDRATCVRDAVALVRAAWEQGELLL